MHFFASNKTFPTQNNMEKDMFSISFAFNALYLEKAQLSGFFTLGNVFVYYNRLPDQFSIAKNIYLGQ
jgi:hypothetical protein